MKKIEIINKFSAPKSTVLITNEELPEEIWIGDKAKINGETYTITGVPISDRNTFVVDKTDKINVGHIFMPFFRVAGLKEQEIG